MKKQSGRVSERLFLETIAEWMEAQKSDIFNGRLNGVYHFAFTIWLMLFQRLESKSMKEAIAEEILQSGDGILEEWQGRSRKLRTGNISQSTGGFTRARQRIGLSELASLSEHIRRKLQLKARSKERVFVIDGTTVTIAHTKQNTEYFGLHKMPGGDIHFPRMRVVAAHDLSTGIPTIPISDTLRVGECDIAERVVSQLPKDSVLLGDRGFGIFRFVHLVEKGKKRSVVRLTDRIFKKVAGGLVDDGNWERAVTWTPSKDDLANNKEHFDGSASVTGRIVQCQINRTGYRPMTLRLFTTTDLTVSELVELYLQRWQVETWVRNIKQDLNLAFINAKHPDMVQKELYVAYMAFAMVCATMAKIADHGKVAIKRISFSYVQNVMRVVAGSPDLDKQSFEKFWTRLFTATLQVKIPNRTKPRSYPRIIKRGKSKFPRVALEQNLVKLSDKL
jgi:hypothetical protein